jgi:hypothetical protein
MAKHNVTQHRDLDTSSDDACANFLACVEVAKFLQKSYAATVRGFVEYFLTKVIPFFEQVPEKHRLPILRAVTLMTRNVPADVAALLINQLWTAFCTYLPKAEVVAAVVAVVPAAEEVVVAEGVVPVVAEVSIHRHTDKHAHCAPPSLL